MSHKTRKPRRPTMNVRRSTASSVAHETRKEHEERLFRALCEVVAMEEECAPIARQITEVARRPVPEHGKERWEEARHLLMSGDDAFDRALTRCHEIVLERGGGSVYRQDGEQVPDLMSPTRSAVRAMVALLKELRSGARSLERAEAA